MASSPRSEERIRNATILKREVVNFLLSYVGSFYPPFKVFKKSLLKKKKTLSHSDVLLTLETAGVSTILIRAEFYCMQTSGSIRGREPLSKPEDQMNRLIKYHHVGGSRQEDL